MIVSPLGPEVVDYHVEKVKKEDIVKYMDVLTLYGSDFLKKELNQKLGIIGTIGDIHMLVIKDIELRDCSLE